MVGDEERKRRKTDFRVRRTEQNGSGKFQQDAKTSEFRSAKNDSPTQMKNLFPNSLDFGTWPCLQVSEVLNGR